MFNIKIYDIIVVIYACEQNPDALFFLVICTNFDSHLFSYVCWIIKFITFTCVGVFLNFQFVKVLFCSLYYTIKYVLYVQYNTICYSYIVKSNHENIKNKIIKKLTFFSILKKKLFIDHDRINVNPHGPYG